MNSTYHLPLSVDLKPLSDKAGAPLNVYNLSMCYREGGNAQSFMPVHVPAALRDAILQEGVEGIHLETLEMGSHAWAHWPDKPRYAIIGLKTKSGGRLSHIPSEVARARWLSIGNGCVLGAVGVCSILFGHAWLGAAALVLGSHYLRDAKHLRFTPFITQTVYS